MIMQHKHKYNTLTSVQNLVEGGGNNSQFGVWRITNLHHEREHHNALRLVLRLGHVVVEFLVEAVDLYLWKRAHSRKRMHMD